MVVKSNILLAGIYVCAIFSLVTACGTTPTKNGARDIALQLKRKSADTVEEVLYQQGQRFWQTWEEDNNTGNLQVANGLFKKAWEQVPDNLNYQHAYYLSSVYLGFYTEDVQEEELLPLYNRLAPSVKAEVPPPARMMYAIANFKNQAPEKLIPLAQRAIQQKPEDLLSWKQLSEQYMRLEQYQLAAATAWKAYEKDPAISDYAWQLGTSLAKVADDSHCKYEAALERSAFYTARAAALQKDNALWYAESAQRYIELGLLPLARHQIQKSQLIEPNASYLTAYIYASIIEGSAFQTSKFITEAEQIQHTHESFKALAMAAATLGEWKNAREFMNLAQEQSPLDVYDLIIYAWLEQLAKKANSTTSQQLRLASYSNEDEQAIADFILADGDNVQALTKKLQPTNACSQQKVDFYSAVKNWQVGDTDTAARNLQSAARSPHFFSREKVWASAFLQGINFKE